MEPSAGALVNDELRLVSPLGEGAMGTVWLADHLRLDTRVAVKFVSTRGAQLDPASADRLETEARAAARIDSDHIVQVLEHGTTEDGTPFIAMELLHGESLGDRVRRDGPLSLTQVANIVAEVARALDAAHAAGIVHRDIKPDNLFLLEIEDGPHVKLLDFGFAKPVHLPDAKGLTAPGMMVGTPKYISPEQLLDPRRVEPSRDRWALAVVAYYALTGRHPFEGDELPNLLQQILLCQVEPPSKLRPELPETVDAWFARALNREPAKRFGSATQLAQTLLALVDVTDSATGQHAADVASPERVIETALEELALDGDKARVARLHFEIARQSERLGRVDDAARHYREALAGLPQHLPSLRGARRCLLAQSDADALALFDSEVRVTTHPADKVALHLAKGRACLALGRDRAEASAAFDKAAELDPTDPSVILALSEQARAAEDWAQVTELLSRAAGALESNDALRAALLSRIASTTELRLEDGDAALELYAEARSADAHATGSGQALERLLDARRAWARLAPLLQDQIARQPDLATRTALVLRLTELMSEHLGGGDAAAALLWRAVDALPSEPLLLDELERLLASTGDGTAVAAVLERKVPLARGAAERLDLMHRLGQISEPADLDEAAGWYESALANAPGHEPTMRALERVYRRARRYEPLVTAAIAHAEALEDPQRRAHMELFAAELYEGKLDDPERAMRHYAIALGLDSDRIDAFKALERLYRSHGHPHQLVELWEREVERAADQRHAVEMLMRMGSLYQTELDDPTAAVGCYRRVLDKSPEHLGAILALQDAAQAAGDQTTLIEALELEARTTRAERERLALLHRIGRLQFASGDADAAIGTFRRVLERDPAHSATLVSLELCLAEAQRHADLVEVLRARLATMKDAPTRAAHLTRLGTLLDTRLDDRAGAEDCYRQALQEQPGDASAEQALMSLLQRRGDHAGLAHLLEHALERSQDPATRARLLCQLGGLRETKLDDVEGAVRAYQEATEVDPLQPLAARGLVRGRAMLGDARALIDALEHQAQSAGGEDAAGALLQAADLRASLGAPADELIASYQRTLERKPNDLTARLALLPLLREQGDHAKLAESYAVLAEHATDVRFRVSLLEERARALGAAACDDERQVEVYRAILELEHDNRAALENLERLALRAGDATLLADVDRSALAATRDRTLAAAHGTRLGTLLAKDEPAHAVEAFALALEREPDNLGAIRGLRAAAVRTNTAELEASALRREAAWTRDPRRAAERWVESGLIRAHSGERSGAIDDFEHALRGWPDHRVAAEQLTMLASESGEHDRLLDRLALAARTATDPERRVALWQNVARLRAAHRGDIPGAIRALERCRELDDSDVATALSLSECYERNAQWLQAAELLRHLLTLLPDDWDPAPTRIRLARLFSERLDRGDDALEQLKGLSTPAALALRVELLMKRGDVDAARLAAREMIDGAGGGVGRAAALSLLARVESHGDRSDAALAAYREALVIEGAGGTAAQELLAMARGSGSYEDYATALREHLDAVANDAPTAVPTWCELARTLEVELARPTAALDALREAIGRVADGGALTLALADTLIRAQRPTEAIGEIELQLRRAPHQAESWRALSQALLAMGHEPEAALAIAPALWLQGGNEAERQLVERWSWEPGSANAGSFDASWMASLSLVPDEEPLVALLGVLSEVADKLFTLDRGGAQRVATDDPLHPIATRVAEAFGVSRFELWLHPSIAAVEVFPGRTARVLAPASVVDRPAAAAVLLLARGFVLHVRGLTPALSVSDAQWTRALTAAVRTEVADFGKGDAAMLDDLGKRIVKASSRRHRKALAAAARAYAAAPVADLTRWRAAAQQTATRAAAVLAGRLDLVLDALATAEALETEQPRAKLVASSPVLTDLLRFWMSERAIQLRRHAGLLG